MTPEENVHDWVLCYIDKVIEEGEDWLLRLGYFVLSSEEAEVSWDPDTDVGIEFGLLPLAAVLPASLVVFNTAMKPLTSEKVRLVFDEFPARKDLTVTQDYLFLRIAEDVASGLMRAAEPPFRGCVLRISTSLFRDASRWNATDSAAREESSERMWCLPEDTKAFRDWNSAVIERIKARYAEKTDRNLLSRYGRNK